MVGVEGTSGGCGASTTAAALAVRAALAGIETVLVEAGAGGVGLDVLSGADHVAGVRWSDLRELRGAVDPAGLLGRLPAPGGRLAGLRVLAAAPEDAEGPDTARAAAVLAALLTGCRLLVVDLPRDGVPDNRWWRARADVLLAVCGPSLTQVASAGAWMGRVRSATVGHRDAPWVRPALLAGSGPYVGQLLTLARDADLEVQQVLPSDPAVRSALAAGEPVGTRGRLVRPLERVLAQALTARRPVPVLP